MDKNFTVEQVKSALTTIQGKISEPQKSMLRAHYYRGTLSMERIASFGGYGKYRAGNSQYGGLCGRIARELGFVSPGDQTYTIAEVTERDAKGHAQWRMDDVVVRALKELRWFPLLPEVIELPTGSQVAAETELQVSAKARIGQDAFRIDVLALWGGCAVTGCSRESVLAASHIVPWKDATDIERLDPFNGLLLTPNLHSLFDQFLIAFNDDGSILLSKGLTAEERAILGVSEKSKLRFVRPAMLPYLQRHRELFRAQG